MLIFVAVVAPYMVSAQSKMAHVNTQDVLAAMPSYNLAIQKLEEYQEDVQKEIEMMIVDYQKVEANLNQNMQSWTPVRIQIEQEKLAKKAQAIEERQQSAQMELQAYSNELNTPILDAVEKSVQTVSKRNGYDYVFDVSTLMIANGPDITKEVIQEVQLLEKQSNPPPPEVISGE